MWFAVLALILGISLLIKSAVGLLYHESFYSWDKEQYLSRTWPLSFLVFAPYGLIMFFLTWYATLFHYVEYGWIVTALVSISGLKLVSILFNWKASSQAFVSFIDNAGWKLWIIDIALFPTGLLFIILAVYIYL